MRIGEVVQPGDVPELERQVDGGFTVSGKVVLAFDSVTIGVQLDVEGVLNLGRRAADLDFVSAAGPADNGKAILFGEGDDAVVILLRGSEPVSEFCGVSHWWNIGLCESYCLASSAYSRRGRGVAARRPAA